MIDVRIPKPFTASSRFFGLFSGKDLARITAPTALIAGVQYPFTGTTHEIASIILVLIAGVIWTKWTPYGYKIDQLLYHSLRWLTQKNKVEDRTVEEKNEDHVVLENSSIAGVIKINSFNLEAQTEAEQAAVHTVYQELLESLNYPIQITSRQKPLDLSKHREQVENTDSPREYLKQDYLEYCKELASSDITTTRHYLTIHIEADGRSTDTLKDELNARINEILERLNTGDLSGKRLTKTELHQFTRDTDYIQPRPTPKYTETAEDEQGRYRRTVYLTEYPSTLPLAWPIRVLQTDAQVEVTQIIEPVNASQAVKKLQRLQEKLEAEINSLLNHGHRRTEKLESTLEDTQWFLNRLADRESQAVKHGIYITVTGDTKEECDQGFEKVCNRLETNRIEYREPFLRTDQTLRSTSLRTEDILDEKQVMPTSSAAASLSFATKGTSNETGTLYGTDTTDDSPILLDRFNWNAAHTARIGATGSGKSYAEKLELLRTRLTDPDINIYILDPKNEYGHLTQALDGETIEAGQPLSDRDVVAVQVPERGQQANIGLLIKTVEKLYQVTSQNQGRSLVVVDEAHNLMRRSEGREVLGQFIREARDTDTAVTLISQNAADFTEHQEGRAILDNTPAKIFTLHERVPDSVTQYFQLSQREKQDLLRLKTGTDAEYSEAILKVSNQIDTKIRITSTPSEHAIIETGQKPATPVPDPVEQGSNEMTTAADGGDTAQLKNPTPAVSEPITENDSNSSLRESFLATLSGAGMGAIPTVLNIYLVEVVFDLPEITWIIIQFGLVTIFVVLLIWGDDE